MGAEEVRMPSTLEELLFIGSMIDPASAYDHETSARRHLTRSMFVHWVMKSDDPGKELEEYLAGFRKLDSTERDLIYLGGFLQHCDFVIAKLLSFEPKLGEYPDIWDKIFSGKSRDNLNIDSFIHKLQDLQSTIRDITPEKVSEILSDKGEQLD